MISLKSLFGFWFLLFFLSYIFIKIFYTEENRIAKLYGNIIHEQFFNDANYDYVLPIILKHFL